MHISKSTKQNEQLSNMQVSSKVPMSKIAMSQTSKLKLQMDTFKFTDLMMKVLLAFCAKPAGSSA